LEVLNFQEALREGTEVRQKGDVRGGPKHALGGFMETLGGFNEALRCDA
jgi:hypothetical protein